MSTSSDRRTGIALGGIGSTNWLVALHVIRARVIGLQDCTLWDCALSLCGIDSKIKIGLAYRLTGLYFVGLTRRIGLAACAVDRQGGGCTRSPDSRSVQARGGVAEIGGADTEFARDADLIDVRTLIHDNALVTLPQDPRHTAELSLSLGAHAALASSKRTGPAIIKRVTAPRVVNRVAIVAPDGVGASRNEHHER